MADGQSFDGFVVRLNNVGIKENLTKIKEQIRNNNVKIIAVTKYASDEQIVEAYNLGIRDFAESYAQDATSRISKLASLKIQDSINWHFIGRLQSNKVKKIVGKFCLIHSVDSLELAKIINNTAYKAEVVQDILFQVNILNEETKAGFKEEEVISLFKWPELNKLVNIKIKGLMTIAPKTDDQSIIKKCFMRLSNLKSELENKYMIKLNELSMGMSNDYLQAVHCGSTMVRIGRRLFQSNKNGG